MVVNCVFTAAPIYCCQAWKIAYRGVLKAHIAIRKAILMKELKTIIAWVKCLEIQAVSEHKSFELQHVLTSVVLSKVWTGAPIGQCRFLKHSTLAVSLHLRARNNIFLILHVLFLYLPPKTNIYIQYICFCLYICIYIEREKLLYLSMKQFLNWYTARMKNFTPLRLNTFRLHGGNLSFFSLFIEDKIWGTCRVRVFFLSKTAEYLTLVDLPPTDRWDKLMEKLPIT